MNKKSIVLMISLSIIGVIGLSCLVLFTYLNRVSNQMVDTGVHSDAQEFMNSIERYQRSFAIYPWEAIPTSPPPFDIGASGMSLVQNQEPLTWIYSDSSKSIVGSSELKPEFVNRPNFSKLVFWYKESDDLLLVCFKPENKKNTDMKVEYDMLGRYVGVNSSESVYSCVTNKK